MSNPQDDLKRLLEAHEDPDFQRGQIDALCVIVAAAGCMASVRRFGDELSEMHHVAEENGASSPSTTYWRGYINAIDRVRRDLPYGEPGGRREGLGATETSPARR
ncbi:MAG: hypothetical protein OXJ54_07815 [Gemmatimonadetes bacterium]|nr:hypothetical protein [Candidatus Palauibacter rhopaloidicola]